MNRSGSLATRRQSASAARPQVGSKGRTEKPLPTENLTSQAVVNRTGATMRQLQWWDEQGYVVPIKDGHLRLYDPGLVRRIDKLVNLRSLGVPLQAGLRIVKRGYDLDEIIAALELLKRHFRPGELL